MEPRNQSVPGKCDQHPQIAAAGRCSLCSAWVCPTCDFPQLGVHLCPQCATTAGSKTSGEQRVYITWSLVMALWSTLTIGAMFLGVFARFVDGSEPGTVALLGLGITGLVAAPAVAGVGLAMAAVRRRCKPAILWVAYIWNWLIILIFIGLTIIGNLSK